MTIVLDGAAKVSDKGRYERKYFLSEVDPFTVLNLIKHHPALFRSPYPARWVNNIYFDDAGHQRYWDHVNGSTNRFKVRIRWYGAFTGTIVSPTLEIKSRKGEMGYKRSWPLRRFSVDDNLTAGQLAEVFQNSSLPADLVGFLLMLRPVSANRYLRRYFVSGDGQVRLTVDTDLTILDCLPIFKHWHQRTRTQEGIILEFKYYPAAHQEAVQIAQSFPFRTQRISKYVSGLVGWDPGT